MKKHKFTPNLISISLRDAYIRLRRIYPAILLWLPEAPLLIIVNYDHLKMLENGNIDAILENKIDVQISRRKIKNLKEKLGLWNV